MISTEVAKKLGVSHTALIVKVEQLKKQGYDIEKKSFRAEYTKRKYKAYEVGKTAFIRLTMMFNTTEALQLQETVAKEAAKYLMWENLEV